ncbi:MAG: hypothetical protein KGJ64_09540, partial [Betaproteobacteria bacterium]|nr:hypothetical protein [Betaproteobacteria bacterium]
MNSSGPSPELSAAQPGMAAPWPHVAQDLASAGLDQGARGPQSDTIMDRVRVLMQIIPVGFVGSIVPTGFMAWVLRDQLAPP